MGISDDKKLSDFGNGKDGVVLKDFKVEVSGNAADGPHFNGAAIFMAVQSSFTNTEGTLMNKVAFYHNDVIGPVTLESTKIKDLKKMVFAKFHFTTETASLMLRVSGQNLDDDEHTLSEYGVSKSQTVYIDVAPKSLGLN